MSELHNKKNNLDNLNTVLHASCRRVVQAGALFVVGGIDIGSLILALVQLGSGPLQDHLEALSPLLFILLGAADARLQRPLTQQDLQAHTQQVQRSLIVNVALVGVAIFGEKERPAEKELDCKSELHLRIQITTAKHKQ